MQTASTPAPYPPTHPPIQNGYQPLTESEIYAIKRQYLGLLPPLQIIDICLTFEAHAPLHVKSTVWPYDIRAAIAAIQAQNAQISQHAQAQQSSPSLDSGDQPKSTSPPNDSPSDTGDKIASSSSEQLSGPTVTHGPVSGSVTPSAAAHPPPPPQSLPHYPHQPYYHPSYPHAPYYPAPPQAHYSFPHPYPPYPHPPPAQYQSNPPPPPPPSHPPPLFTSSPLAHPSHPSEQPPPSSTVDDLPSYEEMIVEALIDFGDPEGCAPKALFSWMASHYPLQSNFRPSASQALQKAFKRGRLEKGNNGKYRLNSNWEGGNTSKRTTRRPQTHAQTALSAHQGHVSSSPFTHIPLVHDADAGASSSQPHVSAQGQPGHPYGFGYPGPSASTANHRPQPAPSETQTAESQVREGGDAWEAAQNILKAINFGQLFQISNEDGSTHADTAMVAQAPPVFAGSVEVSSTFDNQAVSTTLGTSLPSHNTETLLRTELSSDERAALQAELALLAAQLAEFADVSEDELAQDLNPPRSIDIEEGYVSAATTKSQDSHNSVQPLVDQMNSEDDDDDDMDMVEVHVPMASLIA
ncbi:hypothetical protein DEU56DRAFT_817722 [Suillus clintonianus]|uniref:uncharacterized protein n=1 Tax=Suillus clintonianus TaxID=1904413 RepID=UPI001B87FAD1|nr:uncharacterized protein DEU56DRAFT_817722 [Suillus clintonianus]KAG2129119.1 hypothetical protein DEU56DRAFT_817722 [Suillus clintonianus]